MNRLTIKLLIITLTFCSCTVLKPDSSSIEQPDYNRRVKVAGAHYDQVLTPVGYTGIIASTVAGGYYGYKSEMTQYYSGTERKTAAVGNVLIGAAAGFTVSYLLNKAFGWGMQHPVSDPNKWVEKANKNFVNIGGGKSDFELVHKSAHNNWAVKQFKDVDDFTKAFPGSDKTNDVFWAGGQVFSRKELPQLISKKTDNPFNIKIKYRYLRLSKNTLECIEAKNLYFELKDSAEYYSVQKVASIKDVLAVESNWPKTKYSKTLGEKYYNLAETTTQFVDVANKYSELDSLCELKAAEKIKNYSDIEVFNKKWNNSNVGKIVESKAVQVCSRDELKKFIELFPQEYSSKAKKEYIASAPDYREFIRSARLEYPGYISLPEKFNEVDLASVEEHYNNLLNNDSFFSREQLSFLRNNLLDISLNTIYTIIKEDNPALLKFLVILNDETWLTPTIRENGSKNYLNIVTQQISYNVRIEEFTLIKLNGDIEDMMGFVNKYPNTPEANTFTEELNAFVRNKIQISDITHWIAKGDGSWLNDLAETSREFIHGGQDYNVFVLGVLKNYSDVPIKLTLSVDIIRLKTCGVSILRSTSEDRRNSQNTIVVPPNGKMPFLCVYQNMSEGTVVGSGLLSAGCTYRWAENPIEVNKSLYSGEITQQQMINHINWVKSVVAKGNVDRTLSPNEKAEEWVKNTFGVEPDGKTTLRITNTVVSESVTIISIKNNGKDSMTKSIEIDGNEYEDFELYSGNYEISTSRGKFNINVKGRITQLLINKKDIKVDYDDVD